MDGRFELAFECQEAWEEMREVAPGERHCARCTEKVVDLSRMTKKKALAVLSSPSPPCVSYLVRGDEPVFARAIARGGALAAAASLLAACSTADAPTCELSPEPVQAPLVVTEDATVGAPTVTFDEGPTDTALPGDENDVDGVTPAVSRGGNGPRDALYHRVRGRIRRTDTATSRPGDRNDR